MAGRRRGALALAIALAAGLAACAALRADTVEEPSADLLGDEPGDGTPGGMSAAPQPRSEPTAEQLEDIARWQREADKKSEAAERLGAAYAAGQILPMDLKSALELLTRATDMGSSTAPNRIGVLYCYGGPGLIRDPKLALTYFQLGAQRHDPKALYNLGQQYRTGEIVERDEEAAFRAFKEAASQPMTDQTAEVVAAAQTNLGIMYMDGAGTKADEHAAVELWKQAADADNVRAWYYLGVAYATGRGIAQDRAQARRWLEKADRKRYPPAKQALERFFK